MRKLNSLIQILAHEIIDLHFYSDYKRALYNQKKKWIELKEEQNSQLQKILRYAYSEIPYYHRLFKERGLKPDDIRQPEELRKLPILTKDIIRKNWQAMKPVSLERQRYREIATGGSTGTPLRYRQSIRDRILARALLYRGWGYAGYGLGDRLVFLGGSSLGKGIRPGLSKLFREFSLNAKILSSFDMMMEELGDYILAINKKRPEFIYGYASSIYFLSNWLMDNNLEVISPKGIFTTAEKLYPEMRKKISEAFNCEVFDTYGLNDGSISAFECKSHSGLHIDSERGILQIIDKETNIIEEGEGQITATSLYNYAMPFIRYHTEDVGILLTDKCNCGRPYPLLKEIKGREQDMLITPEGGIVHGEFFTHIFWEIKDVREFQVTQENLHRIRIKIVPSRNFNEEQIEKIRETISSRSKLWVVEVEIVDKIDRTRAGKYRFVRKEAF